MEQIHWKYADERQVFRTDTHARTPFLSFRALEELSFVVNGFSTRLGGASTGKFATMNFSYSRGDNPDHVLENYTRMAQALGVERDRMVVSWQTHTTNIRQVTRDDEGKGVITPRDYQDVDGLISNLPGITLVTFYADCVPLYFVDPKNRAVGLSHSGWRGTVNRMGEKTLLAMKKAYGTCPEDVIVGIGPSICENCFEVGEEVVEAFQQTFASKHWSCLWRENGKPGKFQLNLWKANQILLEEAGVCRERIAVTNICTRCNWEYLFSHRKCGDMRGNLAAFLGIKEG